MTMEAQEIADRIGGELEGQPDIVLHRVQPPESAGDGDLAWIADDRPIPDGIAASAVIVGAQRTSEHLGDIPAIIRHDNSNSAFARAILLLHPEPDPPFSGISDNAQIHADATIEGEVSIAPGAFIDAAVEISAEAVIHPGVVILGPSSIGAGVVLHSNVVIYAGTTIGDGTTIHAGSVIGGDGFGYASGEDGPRKIPHRGGVMIGRDVEIGCNCTIDRGALEDTSIGEGSKIDNLVHIAHNVDVGSGCYFAAQVGIAGSSTIGDGCEFGGQSGMIGHIEVGDRTRVAAKSAIMRSFDGQQLLMGIPADDARQMRKIFGIMSQLPELRQRIRDLEQQLKQQTDSSTSS